MKQNIVWTKNLSRFSTVLWCHHIIVVVWRYGEITTKVHFIY